MPDKESPRVKAYCPTPDGAVIEHLNWKEGGEWHQAVRTVSKDSQVILNRNVGHSGTLEVYKDYMEMIDRYTDFGGEPERDNPTWYDSISAREVQA